jgi:hypothetical protein
MRAKTLSALFIGLALLLPASTQAGDDAVTEMKPVSVAAFKNGLAFVIKRGTARLRGGEGRIGFAPAATLGTLWVAPAGDVSLDELVAYRYQRPKSRAAQSVQELFALNVGKTVTIEYANKELTGEILPTPEEKPAPPTGDAAVFPRPGGVLLLRVDGKTVALNANYVNILSFSGEPNLQVTGSESLKALRFKVKGAGESTDLTMGYLEKGLGWTPSYLLSLKDETTAQITLQAVVVNDAEDIAGTDLFFVVGVPNFRYADVPSPMALQQSLAEMIGSLSVNGRYASAAPMSNAVMSQRSASDTEYGANAGGIVGSTMEELVGAPEEDLFLYSKPGATLAKGERATYNVFTAPVAIEHIYEWEVAASQQLDRYGNPTQQTPDTTENNVWHSLRMTNSTKFPWTSAPALVISGTKPISQDTLLYTPKGAKTNLKLTVATDVRADRQELEVDRKPRVLRWNGSDFDAVTVEGTLKVRNYKSKAIALHISKTVPGEVLSATDDGKSEKLAEAIRSANPTTRITWEVTIKPGGEKVITYRYKVMVRS